jgi:hypothetical protein
VSDASSPGKTPWPHHEKEGTATTGRSRCTARSSTPQIRSRISSRPGMPRSAPGISTRQWPSTSPMRRWRALLSAICSEPARASSAERRARIAAARSLNGPQHPGRLRPVAGVEPVKRRHRRELAVHRRCPAVMRLLAQHGNRPVPALRRQPQPRHELPDKPHKRERRGSHSHSADSKINFLRHSREALTRIHAVDRG